MFQHRSLSIILALLVILALSTGPAAAQGNGPSASPVGTAFTYQGQLKDGSGNPITATCDFRFNLYDAATSGTQVGSTLTKTAVTVSNGLFNVALDFGSGIFTGNALWLQIAVRCPAGSGSYTTLSPLQSLTAAPYSLYSSTAGNATTVTNGLYSTGSYANPSWLTSLAGSKITGAVASATIATNFSGSLAGDVTGTQGATSVTKLRGVTVASTTPTSGQVLQYNGTQWTPASALAAFWSLTGNSSTDPATNFLGTLDNVALEFRVNNSRALRLEPNATSPNIIGGYSGNWVTAGVTGAVIGGGGESGSLNRVTDNFGVVGGGIDNQAGDNAGTTSAARFATVGGGGLNVASGGGSTVSGGQLNTASGFLSTIGGGDTNAASGAGAFIGGGGYDGTTYKGNTAAANAATIAGGFGNQVTSGAIYATVSGGDSNIASGEYATIGGGDTNAASGAGAFVGGGGYDGTSYSGNAAAANAATIAGGWGNHIPSGADYATVGGGYDNTASGVYSTVSGGAENTASGGVSTVAGGYAADATHWGEMAHANGFFATPGDAQASEYVLRNTTIGATQTELFLDGFDKRITLAPNRTLSFDILIVAHSNTWDSAGFEIKGIIENAGGTTGFVGTPTVTVLGKDSGAAAWDAVAQADNADSALVIMVSGGASTNIRWVASVRTVEVGY